MFDWWKQRKKNRQWKQFRDELRHWSEIHEQAKQFTFMKCHWCYTPAHHPEANFCSNCGASFHVQPGHHHQDTPPGLHTTKPLVSTEPLQVAPNESYRRQLQQMISEQDTQQVSAARPVGIKRTVHIPRLERFA